MDNQIEPLANTFFDLNQNASAAKPYSYLSSFTQEFSSAADKGNSDFDQRQNLVFFLSWTHWLTFSTLGAVRSGLPYSVYAPISIDPTFQATPVLLINERASLISPADAYVNRPAAGGRLLLNAAAFTPPPPYAVGSSGRNEFVGPGLVNFDLSVSRRFALRERLHLVVRADAYNFLNHANLGNPNSFLTDPGFGKSQYGRQESAAGFPLVSPLSETARQVQVLLRLEF